MLTIVLPASGRLEFNPRFYMYVNRLPYKLIESIDPEEVTVERWRTKIYELLSKVETQYAMICDNDDLPTNNLTICCQHLDDNPDYVCASGRIQGFWMWPDPVRGPQSAVTPQYAPYDTPADYNQDDRNERVLAGFANSWSYYAVYRTQALQRIWREVCALGLTNLQVHEKFCAMRTLTMGKAKCFSDFTSLFRQHGTSHGAPWNPIGGKDMGKVLVMMAGTGVNIFTLTRYWDAWYDTRNRYFQGTLRKTAKAMFPTLAWYVQNRYRYLPHQSLPTW